MVPGKALRDFGVQDRVRKDEEHQLLKPAGCSRPTSDKRAAVTPIDQGSVSLRANLAQISKRMFSFDLRGQLLLDRWKPGHGCFGASAITSIKFTYWAVDEPGRGAVTRRTVIGRRQEAQDKVNSGTVAKCYTVQPRSFPNHFPCTAHKA